MVTKNEIIAKAWKDPAFKKKLLEHPKETLKECGYTFHENVTVKVIEESSNSYTFVLPAKPAHAQNLSDAALNKIAAGGQLDAGEIALLKEMKD
jgi:hypothetical protein